MNRTKFNVALVSVPVSAGAYLAVQISRTREPTYHGRGLSAWLTQLDSGNSQDTGEFESRMLPLQVWSLGLTAKQEEAAKAIRQFGPNILPYLVGALTNTDSPRKLKLVRLLHRKAPFKFSIPLATDRKRQAVLALGILGAVAEPAIPQLVKALHDPDVCYEATTALVAIGPEGWAAIHKTIAETNRPASSFPFLSWENYDTAESKSMESLLTTAVTNRTKGPGEIYAWALL